MRRVPMAVVMVALVGGVLAVSIWTVHRAGREALGDFRATQAGLAKDTASALRVYLDSFDRDTRLLATLARGIRQQAIDERAQDGVILDAFQALATVVTYYRTIALVRTGRPPLVAMDPTEDRTAVLPALVTASKSLAAATATPGKTSQTGPLTLGNGRSFYLYAAAIGDGDAVVVASDAAVMLEAVSRRPTGSRGLVVIDPSGAVWLDCEHRQQCRLLPPHADGNAELMQTIDSGQRDEVSSPHPGLARFGLPARIVVGATPPVASPLGIWSVAVLAPAADIDVRQRAFLWQLVVTSIGVAAAMLAVGLLAVRQHATAAALGARLQAAEEVATLQRQLVRAEKLVTVGVLSAGIAHEIGTPLAVVRGRAEHMLERRVSGHDTEDLASIVREIDRISSTIRRVLEFSRDHAVETGAAHVREALARTVDLIGWRLVSRGVSVVVDAPPGLPAVAVDPDQLEQVLINLIMNSCDASAPGDAIHVTVAPDRAHEDRIWIEIADRGAGIPAQNLNAVFDPYFTTKQRGEGTGLGLAVVLQIVRSHHAEISLKSKVGGGTVATLSWPIAKAQAAREGLDV